MLIHLVTLNLNWDEDVYEDYSDNFFDEIVKGLFEDQNEAKEYREYVRAYIKFEKNKNIDDLKIEDLMILFNNNFVHFDELLKPKFPNGFYTCIIFDDILGTTALRLGRSRLTYYMLKNRHTAQGINFIINTQHMLAIPKSIRMNLNYLAIFRFANKEVILNDISPLISATTTLDQFDKLYSYAIKDDPHDALNVDSTKSKVVFKRNLDTLLELKS